MQEINDCINLSVFQEEKKKTSINPLSKQLVDLIFMKFMSICRGFDALYKGNTKRIEIETTQWALVFTQENITHISQIEYGLKRLSKHKYANPPQLGEFLEWCKPSHEELGLLETEEAYNVAVKINSSFGEKPKVSEIQLELLRYAIAKTDSYDLRNRPKTKTFPVFKRNYELAVSDYVQGKFKSVQNALPNYAETKIESLKKESLGEKYKDLDGYEKAMPRIKAILGIIKTNVNTQ